MPRDDIRLIGVDWGTTNLRVLAIGEDGRLLDSRSDPRGAARLMRDQFPRVLAEAAGDWLDGSTPVLICGMAGGRGRWVEAPYIPMPAGLDDIAAGLIEAAPGVRVAPGAGEFGSQGLIDLMRGEETQALGSDILDGLILAPGTHSKWIGMAGGRIASVRSYMTGELFAVLRAHALLGEGMGDPGGDPEAFDRGLDEGLQAGTLSRALFGVRVGSLAGRLDGAGAADHLSGLLIGAELAGERARRAGPPAIAVIGAPALAQRYGRGLDRMGWTDWSPLDAAETTALGLWRLWRAAP